MNTIMEQEGKVTDLAELGIKKLLSNKAVDHIVVVVATTIQAITLENYIKEKYPESQAFSSVVETPNGEITLEVIVDGNGDVVAESIKHAPTILESVMTKDSNYYLAHSASKYNDDMIAFAYDFDFEIVPLTSLMSDSDKKQISSFSEDSKLVPSVLQHIINVAEDVELKDFILDHFERWETTVNFIEGSVKEFKEGMPDLVVPLSELPISENATVGFDAIELGKLVKNKQNKHYQLIIDIKRIGDDTSCIVNNTIGFSEVDVEVNVEKDGFGVFPKDENQVSMMQVPPELFSVETVVNSFKILDLPTETIDDLTEELTYLLGQLAHLQGSN